VLKVTDMHTLVKDMDQFGWIMSTAVVVRLLCLVALKIALDVIIVDIMKMLVLDVMVQILLHALTMQFVYGVHMMTPLVMRVYSKYARVVLGMQCAIVTTHATLERLLANSWDMQEL
jgi:hypothetical protein